MKQSRSLVQIHSMGNNANSFLLSSILDKSLSCKYYPKFPHSNLDKGK